MSRIGDKPFSVHILATITLIILGIGVMAVYLPLLYEKVFIHEIGKTHLLFSPIARKFVYREKIAGPIPPESYAVATDHKPIYAYRGQDGSWYKRTEFERLVPFIYYKNMELLGLLPLVIDERSFDKETIKRYRRILEIKKGSIGKAGPQETIYPLFESGPGQVRLFFPKDRFRMTEQRMEFVNIIENRVDEALTTQFTKAIKEKGVRFPVRSVNGTFTILKPFDDGVFLVDDAYSVFHLKRINGEPEIVQTGIDPNLKTQYIRVAENKGSMYYGLLLDQSGALHLITRKDYRLVKLPIDGYDAYSMDLKLVMDPLYITVVYSDETTIHGVAMDRNYQTVERFQHRMSRATETVAKKLSSVLFPFSIRLADNSGHGSMRVIVATGGLLSFIGIGASLFLLISWGYLKSGKRPDGKELLLVLLTGLYGLIILCFFSEKKRC